ncbi:hypothetical protein ACWENQ_08500 [Nonomuraea sp. NPDC004354]
MTKKKTIGNFIVPLIGIILLDLLAGWGLMRLLEMLHDEWSSAVPTMGYWTAFFTVVLAGLVLSPFRARWDD